MTHFMFPIVAWWVELEYFARVSSAPPVNLTRSRTESFHYDSYFFGLWLAVSSSTVVNSQAQQPALKQTQLNSKFSSFYFQEPKHSTLTFLGIAPYSFNLCVLKAAQRKNRSKPKSFSWVIYCLNSDSTFPLQRSSFCYFNQTNVEMFSSFRTFYLWLLLF